MKSGFIRGEAIRYARLCSKYKDYLALISLFTQRLIRRGYKLNFIQKAISSVNYSRRREYLRYRIKSRTPPFIFKIEYNPIIQKSMLRSQLSNFSKSVSNNIQISDRIKDHITICYKLPMKLHAKILKARKDKGL